MTKEEKLIVSAYTNVLMVNKEEYFKFVGDKLGREVYDYELAFKEVVDAIKESVKADFLALCEERTKMRDVNRIQSFCMELAELWSNWPDLRFGQFMSNVAKYVKMELGKDIFYMEEDELMKIIRQQLKK